MAKAKKVAWFIPDLLRGSGGHRTILKHASYLSERGYDVSVYLQYNPYEYFYHDLPDVNEVTLKKRMNDWGYPTNFKVKLKWELDEPVDLLFATYWMSAKPVAFEPLAKHKAYFVQDYEAYFNPMSDYYNFAENSYSYGLKIITIGRWLAKTLQDKFNADTYYFDFTADLNIYKPLNLPREKNSIAFIYQPEKPRRGPILGIQALQILKTLIPDLKVYAFGAPYDPNIAHLSFIRQKGILPLKELNRLYNQTEVGLCISYSNPSRIPFEMLASGLPVVEVYKENNLYDYEKGVITLAKTDPESVAYALYELLKNPPRRKKMSQKGIKFMKKRTDALAFEQFEKAVKEIVEGKTRSNKIERNNAHAKPVQAPLSYYFLPISKQLFKTVYNPQHPVRDVIDNKGKHGWIIIFTTRKLKKVYCAIRRRAKKVREIVKLFLKCK